MVEVKPKQRFVLPAPVSESSSARAARENFQDYLNLRADEDEWLEAQGLARGPQFPTMERLLEAAPEILKIRAFQAAVHLGDRRGATAALAKIVSKRIQARVGAEIAAASAWETLRDLAAWELANTTRPLAYARTVVQRHARRQAVALEHAGQFGFDSRAADRLDKTKPWHREQREDLAEARSRSLPDHERTELPLHELLISVAKDDREQAMVQLISQGLSLNAAKLKAGVSGTAMKKFRARAVKARQVR